MSILTASRRLFTDQSSSRGPAALAGSGHLISAPDGTWAFFALADVEYEGASPEQRVDQVLDMVARLVDETGHRVWLAGTSQEWASQDHYDALRRRYPAPLPDRDGARTADDLLRAAAAYPEVVGGNDPLVVLGVRFTRRRVRREHLPMLFLEVPPAPPLGLVAEDRAAYRKCVANVTRIGLSAAPMSEAAVRWLGESRHALGHDNGYVEDVTAGAMHDGAKVRVTAEPYSPTLAVTAIRGGTFTTRHVTIRHLGPTRSWDTDARWPLFGWMNARAVEWVACFDVHSGDMVAPVARGWAKIGRDRASHDKAHGVDIDEGTRAGIARTVEVVAETEHGDPEDATRVWGRVMVAISGDTQEECVAAADVFCSDAARYAKVPFEADFGMDADRWLFMPGEPWGEFRPGAGHLRRWTAKALAAAGPAVTGTGGDTVGIPLGPMAGSSSIYRWHPHGGPESDRPGTFGVVGEQGCGKSSLASLLCDWSASLGIATRVWDPASKMNRLTRMPHLRADAVEFPLTTAGKPGILMPHYLDLDPKRVFYPDGPDGDEEWEDAVAGTKAVRMDRAIDATMMMFPYALTSQDRDVNAIVEAAVAKVGGDYGTHSREIIDAVERESTRGRELAAMLRARAALPDGLMIFPATDVDDAVLDRITSDAALAVITTPGLTLPETTDRAAWTRDHHRAALICSLGWQLAVRDAWASQAPTTVWVDEMGVLMHGVASIGASIKRASTDSRKVNLAAGFASQTGEAFRRIDPDVDGLMGTFFLGRTSTRTAAGVLPLMGLEPGNGWEQRASRLPVGGDRRAFIVSGLPVMRDGTAVRQPREVVIDQGWWHPDLIEAARTTPPAHAATLPDRVRAA